MGLFGDVRKPVTCPSQLVSDAREQDPRGDRLHVGFAALFMFCLPIDTAPASISWGHACWPSGATVVVARCGEAVAFAVASIMDLLGDCVVGRVDHLDHRLVN
jgi:hypothetical protein